MWVRKVQLEYCCESNLFASSDDNLTPQNYKHFPIPQAFWRKKRISPEETLHLRIRRMNHSSSGLNPQKVLPSPPKSHGSVTSIGLFGSRSYLPLPIIIRSRRRNLRLQNCFPRFCDLQQQQVLAGVFFLLLLIMSRMLRVAYAFSCHPVKHYETVVFSVCAIFPFLFLAAKLPIFSKWKRHFWQICERFVSFSSIQKKLFLFLPRHSGKNGRGQRKRILRFVPNVVNLHNSRKREVKRRGCFRCYVASNQTQHKQRSNSLILIFLLMGVQTQLLEIRISLGGSAL